MRELGLGALQVWQALSEAQGRGRGDAEVAILFTDLVDFSGWALDVGDEAALELLRKVGREEEDAICGRGGDVVKRMGDGLMAVFPDPRRPWQRRMKRATASARSRCADTVRRCAREYTWDGHAGSVATTSAST